MKIRWLGLRWSRIIAILIMGTGGIVSTVVLHTSRMWPISLLLFVGILLTGIGLIRTVVREPHKQLGYGLSLGAFALCGALWMVLPPTIRITLLTPLSMGIIMLILTARGRN